MTSFARRLLSDLAQTVAHVYESIPMAERFAHGILPAITERAEHLNLYGPAYGLPRACWDKFILVIGVYRAAAETVIVAALTWTRPKSFHKLQRRCEEHNRYNVVNEESRDHPDILVCRNLRKAGPSLGKFRRFG